ncbi:radical SAM protein, partial [uncultured Desulfovibrio sp.]
MYTILPFNFTPFDDCLLLVNEAGVFTFLEQKDFDDFIRHRLSETSSVFDDLESDLFLTTGDVDQAVRKLAARYRSRKEYLRDFTSLHMMVITLRCNQKCGYCQVSSADEDSIKYDMSVETAKKIVDFILSAPTDFPKIEFQGGEPTINWPTIVATVESAERRSAELGKNVEFVICSNLTSITDEQLHFCKDHKIAISTSLDGTRDIHDKFRRTRFDKGTYDSF